MHSVLDEIGENCHEEQGQGHERSLDEVQRLSLLAEGKTKSFQSKTRTKKFDELIPGKRTKPRSAGTVCLRFASSRSQLISGGVRTQLLVIAVHIAPDVTFGEVFERLEPGDFSLQLCDFSVGVGFLVDAIMVFFRPAEHQVLQSGKNNPMRSYVQF